MPATRRSAPNVLLVVFDTARADAVEPYGAPPGSSPALAQLASRGRAASNAYATCSWTVPSHASLFTGAMPGELGLPRSTAAVPAGYAEAISAQRDRMLPTVLGRNGYSTAGVSANLWVSEDSGFATGFETFRNVDSPRRAVMGDTSLRGRVRWAIEALRARCDDGAAAVEALLGQWLSARDDRPFFWFVNLVECHSPYLPPKPYDDLGALARIRAGLDVQAHQTFEAFTATCLGRFDVGAGALERMRHLYARSVLLMDDWLARVLQTLDTHGVLDDTIVVVTSDHGENFGECELMGHALSLDDRLIRIPFVAAGPDRFELDDVMSLTDVPALLAGLVRIDEHPWDARRDRSVAVAQLEPMCAPDDPIGPAALAELGVDPAMLERIVTPLSCATDGRHKLVRRGDRDVVIDLDADPLETGAAARPPSAPDVAHLRTALDAAASRWIAPKQASAASLTDDLKARMEMLGYL